MSDFAMTRFVGADWADAGRRPTARGRLVACLGPSGGDPAPIKTVIHARVLVESLI
jgi:hypothetical protein